MKYVAFTVLALILAGLAVAEYLHHGSDHHAVFCVDPGNQVEEAKALVRAHLYSHR